VIGIGGTWALLSLGLSFPVVLCLLVVGTGLFFHVCGLVEKKQQEATERALREAGYNLVTVEEAKEELARLKKDQGREAPPRGQAPYPPRASGAP
jgi:hypothetical protein